LAARAKLHAVDAIPGMVLSPGGISSHLAMLEASLRRRDVQEVGAKKVPR
jgi:hypothetical protein